MQDTEAIAREKKAKEPTKPRNVRRLEKSKKEFLDTLLLQYFTKRSSLADPDGLESACLFDQYNHQWVEHCKCFNKRREPIKLKYDAFTEAVEFYIDMEKKQMEKTAEANKELGFLHWLRRAHVRRTRPLTALWYWLRALGDKTKYRNHWKAYYINCVTQKT
jgi:hypothetical protein